MFFFVHGYIIRIEIYLTDKWGTCSADTLNGTVPEVTSNSVLSFEWVCQQTVNSGSSMRVDRI